MGVNPDIDIPLSPSSVEPIVRSPKRIRPAMWGMPAKKAPIEVPKPHPASASAAMVTTPSKDIAAPKAKMSPRTCAPRIKAPWRCAGRAPSEGSAAACPPGI